MRSLLLCLALLASAASAGEIVNDVTGLNPIEVERVLAPTELQQIIDAVRQHAGPISIGGGRYSMGGQTASAGTLQLDMRDFDQVLELSVERREIRVQSGITWREILEYIDPHDLSPQIMQSYANLTVGGSQDAFGRVDRVYPLAVARVAHDHDIPVYVLNSATGAVASLLRSSDLGVMMTSGLRNWRTICRRNR